MAIRGGTVIYADPVIDKWPTEGSFVAFDLEYTAWEGSHARGWSETWEHREIIEMGAVRILVQNGSYVQSKSFSLYVCPTVNTMLSDYITRLTGITDKVLEENGQGFPEALRKFYEFVKREELLLTNGFDGAVLRENCILNKIKYPFKKGQVLNIRPALAAILGCSISDANSGDLPEKVGINFSDVKHSALGDALCVAAALTELKKRGKLS